MGNIYTAQQRMIGLLNADPFFIDNSGPQPVIKVPVIFKKQGDIQSKIDEALAELGVGLVIVFRRARRQDTKSMARDLAAQWALSAISNLEVKDAADPEAIDIAEKAYLILDGKPVVAGSNIDKFEADGNAIQPLPMPKKPMLDMQLLLVNAVISFP